MPGPDFITRAIEYAESIVDGEILSGQYVIYACQRFLNDLERDDLTLYRDRGKKAPANKWCRFLETMPHVKGRWAKRNELFVLSDWQIFCTVNIYGWHWVESGKRRFRVVYICVPRKNGKSFWVACLGLGHLTIDDEFGAEVYCGATGIEQAMKVFEPARLICKKKESFSEHFGIEINKRSLRVADDNAVFQPVIGKPGDGDSPSAGIVDEYHEHADSDQYDTFETGMGARENPMMIVITTAGYNMTGPCYSMQLDIQSILSGAVTDDQFFGVIYSIDENDQWDTVEALRKANPNYGGSVDIDFVQGKLKQARRSADKQVAYKTKHLNMWVGAKAAWMNMLKFHACRKKNHTLSDFKGREIMAGFDLASKIDLATMGILVLPSEDDPLYHYFCYHYLPEDVVLDSGNLNYRKWHSNGWLTTTPGDTTDFDYIETDFKRVAKQYDLKEAPFDPYQATQFSTNMIKLGLPMVEVGQTWKNLSEPMKETQAMIYRKDITFNMDPVLMWMMGNMVAVLGRTDDIFPSKEKPANKIDGIISLIMCVNRVIWYRDNTQESLYTRLAREKKQNETGSK